MKSRYGLLSAVTCAALLFGSGSCSPGGGGNEGAAGDNNPVFSFVPNQSAGNVWYRPGGELMNGHLDESFGNPELWPTLLGNLRQTGGHFSVYAAEIGYLNTKSGLLPLLRDNGIPVSVEMPGFTQCIDGSALGEAELNGKPLNGTDNIFARVFGIVNPSDRPDPDTKGWFFTADRQHFIPDLILFDERQPNLCPIIDPQRLAAAKGTFDERLRAAFEPTACAKSRLPFDELLAALRRDYVDFLEVARDKWGPRMPGVGIHWNVVAGWEWRDQNALMEVYGINPGYFNIANNFYTAYKDYPQAHYKSVGYLEQLIDDLAAEGFKPEIVCMDVDWQYDLDYVEKILLMHRDMLKNKGVQMSINVVEAGLRIDEELYCDGRTLLKRKTPSADPNQLYENTLVAIVQFLKVRGIYEEGMQLRVGSWSERPREMREQVDERRPGSMAHTANTIFEMMQTNSTLK